MVQVIRAAIGGYVPIVLRSRRVSLDNRDRDLFALVGASVDSIKKPDGTSFTPLPTFKYHADGVLVAKWNTSALTDADAGDYLVTIKANPNMLNEFVTRKVVIRLLKQGAN